MRVTSVDARVRIFFPIICANLRHLRTNLFGKRPRPLSQQLVARRQCLPRYTYPTKASLCSSCRNVKRFNVLVANLLSGISEASLEIFSLQPGVACENGLKVVPCCEHPQHMFHCQSSPTDDGLPTKDLRIKRDPLEKVAFGHCLSFPLRKELSCHNVTHYTQRLGPAV